MDTRWGRKGAFLWNWNYTWGGPGRENHVDTWRLRSTTTTTAYWTWFFQRWLKFKEVNRLISRHEEPRAGFESRARACDWVDETKCYFNSCCHHSENWRPLHDTTGRQPGNGSEKLLYLAATHWDCRCRHRRCVHSLDQWGCGSPQTCQGRQPGYIWNIGNG